MNIVKTDVKLSVILPVYNKQNSIRMVAAHLRRIIEDELKIQDYEIIYVDDCSNDMSLAILNELANSKNIVLRHQKNQGQLKAIQTGLKAATGQVFAIYSCDMQNSFETIVPLYNAILQGYDLAVGYRAIRSDNGFVVLLSKIFFRLLSVFESKMPSGGFDFGLFNYQVWQSLVTKDFDTIFLQLEALRVSKKTYYLPTERKNDNFDKSSWTIGSKVRYASKIVKYIFKL